MPCEERVVVAAPVVVVPRLTIRHELWAREPLHGLRQRIVRSADVILRRRFDDDIWTHAVAIEQAFFGKNVSF